MASENLVPVGLPHGERQNVEAGMQAANIPMEAADAPPAGVPSPMAPPLSIVGDPTTQDPLQGINPAVFSKAVPPPLTVADEIRRIQTQTANPLIKLMAQRLLGE